MHVRFGVLLALLSIGCNDVSLRDLECQSGSIRHCGDPDLERLDGIGICQISKQSCIQGVWSDCSNDDIVPQTEICDGLDNDCNAVIDDLPEVGDMCGLDPGVRTGGRSICEPGVYMCVPTDITHYALACVGAIYPGNETCNALDDDCDGLIDEIDDLPVEVCYTLGLTAPELRYGDCRPGVKECINGVSICDGEILPTNETCDGLDNDCDGKIDEELEDELLNHDIVIIIDRSQSMDQIVSAVTQAINDFALAHGSEDHRFALIGIPHSRQDGYIELISNLVPINEFAQILSAMIPTVSGAEESSYDAIWSAGNLDENPLSLDWRQGTKKMIFIFTDEAAQSRMALDEAEIRAVVQDSFIVVYAFVNPSYDYQFDDICRVNGGEVFSIYDNAESMITNMNSVIKTRCGE